MMAELSQQDEDRDEDVIHQLNVADAVEGTVFSKSWVFSLLVQLVNYISKPTNKLQHETKHSSDSTKSVTNDTDDNTDNEDQVKPQCEAGHNNSHVTEGIEPTDDGDDNIDEHLENDLCKLWDASTNIEMCRFLHQHNTVELLVGAITRCTSSRITEICVGIIGNMMCDRHICCEAIRTKPQRNFYTCMLGHHDPGVLTECVRLLMTCLSHEEVQEDWVSSLSSTPSLLSDVSYILQNSANEDLLRVLSVFIDRLLDLNDSLCRKWACESFVLALCEASNQCNRMSTVDVNCTIMLILQSLTTVKEGVKIIVAMADQMSDHLLLFLNSLSPTEQTAGGSSDDGRGLMACLSLCMCIIDNIGKESKCDFKTRLKDCREVINTLSSSDVLPAASDDEVSWYSNDQSPGQPDVASQWQNEDRNNSYNNPFIEEEIKRLAKNILNCLEK